MEKPGIREIPECKCLQCGHRINASGSSDGSPVLPNPGDLVLCIRCGAVMKHADDLSLRGMSDAEMDELTADAETMTEIAKHVRRIHMARHSLG